MDFLNSSSMTEWFSTLSATAIIIALAEIGDKSQLVCMTLAARYNRGRSVLLGAVSAFIILNLLAVGFGATVAQFVPEKVVLGIVAIMFAAFGIHSLLNSEQEDEDEGEIKQHSTRSILATTFLLIFIAEFGDKTQIAVAGIAVASPPVAVWLGATIALALTSALGVLAGKTILQKLPMALLHKISGIFFLALAAFAAFKLFY